MSKRSSHFVHRLQTLPSALAGGPRRLPALAAVLALLALALLPTAAQAQADTTPPALASATVLADGNSIELDFDENLDIVAYAAITQSDFGVTADGNSVTVGSLQITVVGGAVDVITLGDLSPTITHGQVVTVATTTPPPATTAPPSSRTPPATTSPPLPLARAASPPSSTTCPPRRRSSRRPGA